MKLDAAREFVRLLGAAIQRAEQEGRDSLNAGDIEGFVAFDDTARAALEEAIREAKDAGD